MAVKWGIMDKKNKQRPKASVAVSQGTAAKEFLREPFNKRDAVENEPFVLPRLINFAFSLLALHFRTEAKGNSELAHKMAWEWLKGGFPFYPPPETPQRVLSTQLLWCARATARVSNAERRAWKIDTEPLIKFEEACRTDWCRYKSERELISMLKRVGYPEILLSYGLINRPTYEVALQKDHERSKERATKRRREVRKNERKDESPPKPLQ
jgi:hypothetical protein